MKPNIKHKQLRNLINLIVEQDGSDDVYRISPEEYLELLKLSDNSPGVTRIKKFGGKPLYITGDLDVSHLPIKSLGNVVYVDGRLDISDTKISELPDGIAKGYIWDGGTPRETIRLIKQDQEWLSENQERKENGEWEIGQSDEANKVNALFNYLIYSGDINVLDEDEREELVELKKKYERIEKEYNDTEDDEEESELYDKLTELEGDIEGLEERNHDVYNTIVPHGKHYGLDVFNIIPLRTRSNYVNYTVATEDEMDEAIDEYWESRLDDMGMDGINSWVIEDCIDTDEVVEMAEEDFNNNVWDNPESYFDEDDYELSDEQEKRINELEDYIKSLEEYIERMENRQNELDSEIEEPDEYSNAWDEVQKLIDDAEDKKSNAEDEIDNINESAKEVTQEMVDNKVDELVRRVRRDPLDYLKELGYSGKALLSYVNENCVKKTLKDESDYSDMNGYDGSYDTTNLDGEEYYIMRIN